VFVHSGALPHVLSPSDYTSPEVFEAERERVFGDAWHFIAAREQLRNLGDFVAAEILGQAVLVRNESGALVAFRNACAHRHSALVMEGCGHAKTLRCRYHGWEYDAEGKLARVPDGISFKGFKAADFKLGRFRVETLGDLVFVNLSADARPLRETLGDVAPEIERYYGSHRVAWTRTAEYPVNWKVVCENAVESYHLPNIHPESFGNYRDPALHEHVLTDRYTRFRDLEKWGDSWASRVMKLVATLTLEHPEYRRFTHTHLFPHYLLYYLDVYSEFAMVEPLGPSRTRHVHIAFVPRKLKYGAFGAAVQAVFLAALRPMIFRLMSEDVSAWMGAQAGMRQSRSAGILGAREERVYAFQREIARRLGRDVPPPVVNATG
jgi:choline monooxygenase